MSLLKIKPFIIDDTTASDAFVQANAAFNQANTGAEFANGAFDRANAAYAQANTGSTDTWVRTQANTAYDTANSGATFANGSFLRANSSYEQANSGASFANGAFVQANSSASFANGSFLVANAASSFANGAFDRANSSYDVANTGASFANGAFGQANSASSFANAAFVHANAAFNAANTGGGGSSVDTYISLTMTGAITVPYTGTSRFYPPRAMTLSTVYANLSTAASGANFTYIIKKNGTSIGNTFTIIQNQTVMTPANISVSLATTDYLTLDVNGASATDLFVRIKYINT
jgi:hypothetical protein